MRCRFRNSCLIVVLLVITWIALSLLFFRDSLYGHGAEIQENIPELLKDADSTAATSTTPATTTTTLPRFDTYVPLAIVLSGPGKVATLLSALTRCLKSIVDHASAPVNAILICDRKMFELAEAAIKRNVTSDKARLRISYLNLDDAFLVSGEMLSTLKDEFTLNHLTIPTSLAFLPLAMDQILPLHRNVILIDGNSLFEWDIKEFLDKATILSEPKVIGMVRDTKVFYDKNNTEAVKPKNFFYSQAVFFELDRLRRSATWQQAIHGKPVVRLVQKYADISRAKDLSFSDILFLLSFEHPEWFYFLSCVKHGRGCFVEGGFFLEKSVS